MAGRRCTTCPTILTNGQHQCTTCKRAADKARRPNGNPYSSKGHQAFRNKVLAKNPICVQCKRTPATIADHYPHERKELIDLGQNPNDPKWGRGLCKQCHDTHTAKTTGGWHKTRG